MLRRPDSERGETLIELLIALVIMSITVVSIVGALAAVIKVSDIHRKQATGGTAARTYAEVVKNNIVVAGYTSCASPMTYTTGLSAPPAGFNAPVVQVKYWTISGAAGSWATTCTTDIGIQQVTLSVSSTDARASERVVFVLRRPCASGC